MYDIGLDDYLMPKNSPITQSGAVNAYEFDNQYERNSVTTSKIAFLTADKIATGTLVAAVNVGSSSTGYVLIDGPNNRIVINDGTTNRVVIGNV